MIILMIHEALNLSCRLHQHKGIVGMQEKTDSRTLICISTAGTFVVNNEVNIVRLECERVFRCTRGFNFEGKGYTSKKSDKRGALGLATGHDLKSDGKQQ